MNTQWWKSSVVYQIYPRSFKDSNGDGIGDLRGIIEKLDYLQTLGIDVVWLSPVYQSPNDDNGYDISDYQNIMTEFGTLADWDEMLTGMHQRGIKLVMDLVVNHTSDEHAWFVESRKSLDNPYRDYYIWRKAQNGKLPNEWISIFSGPAWEYDPATDEYYLHIFSRKQPDLNWDNPIVRAEVFKMMQWWLDRGVDGFRMDVINMISKGDFFINGPHLLEYLGEMHEQVLAKHDLLTVGETPAVTPEYAIELTNPETGALSMVFHFEHMNLDSEGFDKWQLRPWSLLELKEIITRWQDGLAGKGWNSLYLTNHDQPRAVSRFGDDKHYRVESAKLLATFIHMLQGTPYIYQGEEIGMTNVPFESIDQYRDVETLNMYREVVLEGGAEAQPILDVLRIKSRDNARTPMQWNASPNAGFTSGRPWIMVNPNYSEINVEQALADPNSIFYYYQALIQLRKQHRIMIDGVYQLLMPDDPNVYAFTRTLGNEQWLVLLNFTAKTQSFDLPSINLKNASLIIANYADADVESTTLRPYEARVLTIGNSR